MTMEILPTSTVPGRTRAEARHTPCTILDLLAASARAYSKAPAILAPDRDTLTHAALLNQVHAATRALADAGYGRGSRIALALPEGPEAAVAALAVSCCATCAPLSRDLGEAALFELIVAMRIDALITPEADASPAVDAARRAGVTVVGLRHASTAPAGSFALIAPAARSPVAVPQPHLDDIALLAHTSGTTSRPKIVPHTHRRIAEAARMRGELGQLTHTDRSLLTTPLSNLTTLRRAAIPPLAAGGSVVCLGHFDPVRLIAWIEALAPTHYMASVATHIAILEELERRTRPVKHSLRFVLAGGANLPSDIQTRLERALGASVIAAYGMTETGTIAQVPLPPDRAPAGSVGRPANIDIAIVDEAGSAQPVDALGEILVRGPELFDGYENDANANDAAFRDGWFRTGDLGRIDRDGFLYLAGRIKDLINRGGAKVVPSEIEEVLMEHPEVAQAAAFALPHPTLGEDLAAAVVLRGQGAVSESELRDFALARLAAFKVPTRFMPISELPRGSFGKVKRAELTRIAEEQLRHEFVPPQDAPEALVAQIFAEVLGIDRIGATDNFFQLGGDSLRGARVMARVQAIFGVTVGVEALFRRPTVATLTMEIRVAQARGTSVGTPPIVPFPRHVP